MDLETIKKRIFKNIVVEGFDVDKNGYSFVKKTSKIRCEVGFSLEEDYSVIENEVIDFVKAYCFWASIAYPEMENILHPILAKNELFGKYISTDEISSSFSAENETFFLDEFRNGILIETEFDVENLINRLTSFFNTDALPFFEKWKDLNVLYEYIKDKSIKTNPLAIKVKINDLRDNMDITRLVYITEKDTERLNKYLKAYQELKVCL